MKIGEIIRAGISAGKTNQEILDEVLKAHPNAQTTTKTIAWYRSDMKKNGKPSPKKEAKKAAAATKAIKAVAEAVKGDAFSVKITKTFIGMEGQGYNGKLYRNGEFVATVIDDATGGCPHIWWADHALPRVEQQFRSWKGEIQSRLMTPEEAKFYAHFFDLTYASEYREDGKAYHNEETFLGDLVDTALLEKEAQKIIGSKTKVFYVENGKLVSQQFKKGSTGTLPMLKQAVRSKKPAVQFLNELSIAEVVKVLNTLA